MNIVEFLLARITEDEADARGAGGGAWHRDGTWWLEGVNHDVVGPDEAAFAHPWNVEHIARHDPARVLAECLAKRAIIELHTYEWMGPDDAADKGCEHDYEDWPCPTLRHLASVYADHEDHREEWRP